MRTIAALLALALPLAAAPGRIVSTAPAITETLFALGLGDRVVGVSQYCHYPPAANTRPRVGAYLRPNVEAIVALRPDLVIVEALPESVAPQLARMRLNVLEVPHGSLAVILADIEKIAAACGVPDRGHKLAADIRARLDVLRARTARSRRRSLLFIVGRNPGRLEGLVAVGKGSYLNELIEIAGGANVLAHTAMPYAKVSLDTVLGLNPDVLVDMGDMADTAAVSAAHKREVVALWQRFPSLAAVTRHRVFAVASDIYVVPGPRVVEAAEAFGRMLHPEALP